MRVYGEAFLLINGWIDFLCLLLAARLGRCRFAARKALISASLGGVYGAAAWAAGKPVLRSVPALLLVCLGMALIAFGRRGPRLFPLVAAAGWLLSGLSDFVLKQGAPPAAVIWIDSTAVLGIMLSTRQIRSSGVHYRLRIVYKGVTVTLPAMRDTGNLLRDHASSLPVAVVSQNLAQTFLPPGTRINDLSTLPPGWRLVQAKTAAGSRTLMCFVPDQIMILQGEHSWAVETAIAVADFEENQALLPDSLFYEQREDMCHAVL